MCLKCSRVSTKPVTLDLVGLEHLFSELLVSTILDSVYFESVGIGVHVVVLGEQVADRVESSNEASNHTNNNLLIGDLALAEIAKVLGDVVGHLRGRRWGTIFILDHAVVKLRWHGNDHVIVVGIEVAALGNVQTEGSIVVVTSQQVV